MKQLLLILSLMAYILPAYAAGRENPYITALKLYCAARMEKGKPVTRALFYLKLRDNALRQLDPGQLRIGKTGIIKLDNLNTALHGYLVNWNESRLGLAFEQRKTILPKLIAIYKEAGKDLWDVETTESTTRKPKDVSQIKVELTKRGTHTHKEFKRSSNYSPELTGVKHIDKCNKQYNGTINDAFVTGDGLTVLIIKFESPVPESIITEYSHEAHYPGSHLQSQINSVERHDDLFQS